MVEPSSLPDAKSKITRAQLQQQLPGLGLGNLVQLPLFTFRYDASWAMTIETTILSAIRACYNTLDIDHLAHGVDIFAASHQRLEMALPSIYRIMERCTNLAEFC